MQGEQVTFFVNRIKICILCILFHFFIFIGIISVNSTPEPWQITDDRPSDPSRSKYSHGKIVQLSPLDSRQWKVIDLRSLHDPLHFADCHQHQHQRIVCHTFRWVGYIADTHSEFFCCLQINMIKSNRSCGDHFYSQFMKSFHQLCIDLCCDNTQIFITFCQMCIFQRRCILTDSKLHSIFFWKFLKKLCLIKFSVTVNKNFHTSLSSSPISFYFLFYHSIRP